MKNFVKYNEAVKNYNGEFKELLNFLIENGIHCKDNETILMFIEDSELEDYGKCLSITLKLNESLGNKIYYKDNGEEIIVFVKLGAIDNIDRGSSLRDLLKSSGYKMTLPEDIMIGDFDRGTNIVRIEKSNKQTHCYDIYSKYLTVYKIALENTK